MPQVSTDGWRLRVHGMVDREVELDFAQLLARPMVERDVTLTCVSNEVGGTSRATPAGSARRWPTLLEEAGVDPRRRHDPEPRPSDGMTIGTPTAVVMDGRDAMLAVGMNGEPLPAEHGFPVRMVVPGLYGYVSATKWLVDLELTRFDRDDAVLGRSAAGRRKAPIRTASRIDTPRRSPAARPARSRWPASPGPSTGASRRSRCGSTAGAWQQARLAEVPSADTWRQWVWEWAATPGHHVLRGPRHRRRRDDPAGPRSRRRSPSGATGWHAVEVSVS